MMKLFKIVKGYVCDNGCIHFACAHCTNTKVSVRGESFTEYFSARCEINGEVFLVYWNADSEVIKHED